MRRPAYPLAAQRAKKPHASQHKFFVLPLDKMTAIRSSISTFAIPQPRQCRPSTSKESLHLLKSEWGEDIGQLLGLNSGNTALIEATCGRPCSVDQATLMLMEAAWAALQQ
jgi:hypothetical protein